MKADELDPVTFERLKAMVRRYRAVHFPDDKAIRRHEVLCAAIGTPIVLAVIFAAAQANVLQKQPENLAAPFIDAQP